MPEPMITDLVQAAISAVQDVRGPAEHRSSPAVESNLSAAMDNLLTARHLLDHPDEDNSEYSADVTKYLAANEDAERTAVAQERGMVRKSS